MNKKLRYILILVFIGVGGGIIDYYTQNLVFKVVLYPIRESISSIYENLEQKWDAYIAQSKAIVQLKKENQKLQKYALLYKDLEERCNEVQKICKRAVIKRGKEVLLLPALGYVHYGDYTSLYLKKSPAIDDPKNIYGITYGLYAAGIVKLNENGRVVAYLNGNKKCSYGVMIGKLKAQGVATGTGDNRFIEVRYIPRYLKISIGDEVVTSGLDGIFPFGIPVGKVIALQQTGSYTVAKVRAYADLSHPRFFWLIKL